MSAHVAFANTPELARGAPPSPDFERARAELDRALRALGDGWAVLTNDIERDDRISRIKIRLRPRDLEAYRAFCKASWEAQCTVEMKHPDFVTHLEDFARVWLLFYEVEERIRDVRGRAIEARPREGR